MSTTTNEIDVQSVFLTKPLDSGVPTPDLFVIKSSKLSNSKDNLADGAILIQVMVMSVDPSLRPVLRSYRFKPNEEGIMPMRGFIAGKVLASKNKIWEEGDLFGAEGAFGTFQILEENQLKLGLMWKLTGLLNEAEIEKGVGVLGMTGCTAYAGVVDVLKAKKDEVLFCSAASGAVGSLVAQIAKLKGCKTTIGSCGGKDKGEILTTRFGYDAAIDYKQADTVDKMIAEIKAASPSGIDMYFENVGGIHFDAAFKTLKFKGRIAICGAISGYNEKDAPKNEISLSSMIYTQQRIEGFVCGDWLTGKIGNYQWLKDLSQWLKEGQITSEETVVHGVEQWPEAFCSLFQSGTKHIGKLAVKV